MKRNIKILIVGITEKDPAAFVVIKDLIKKASEQQVYVRLLIDELAPFQDLILPLEKIRSNFRDILDGIEQLGLLEESYYIRSSSKRRMWNEDKYPLSDTVEREARKFGFYQIWEKKAKEAFLSKTVNNILRLQQKAELRELKKVLESSKTPHSIIQTGEKIYKKQVEEKVSLKGKTCFSKKQTTLYKYYSYLELSIQKAISDIIKNVSQTDQTIIILTKHDAIRALTAYFYDAVNSLDKKAIEIIPINVDSEFCDKNDYKELSRAEVEQFKSLSANIKNCYKAFKVNKINFEEDVLSKGFKAKEFDEIEKHLFASEYFITQFNQKKETLISELDGKIKYKYKNGSALVEVDHSKLNKENKEKLGLCRKYLKFEGESSQVQMEYMKNIPGVTSHKTRKENTLCITFPKRISKIVREAYQDWPSVQARYKKFQTKVEESEGVRSELSAIQRKWQARMQETKRFKIE